jgi:hypothetical protein
MSHILKDILVYLAIRREELHLHLHLYVQSALRTQQTKKFNNIYINRQPFWVFFFFQNISK